MSMFMSQMTKTAPLLERITQKIAQANFTPNERSFLLMSLQLTEIEIDSQDQHQNADPSEETTAVSIGVGRSLDAERHQSSLRRCSLA